MVQKWWWWCATPGWFKLTPKLWSLNYDFIDPTLLTNIFFIDSKLLPWFPIQLCGASMTTVPVKDPQVVKMNITTALSPIRNEFYISISFFIFLNYRTLPWTIEVSRDIPRLPTLDVLLDLQQQLNIFHETRPVQSVYPAIQWIGNGRGKLRWYPYLKFLQWCIFCVKPSNNPIFYQLSPSPATFHFLFQKSSPQPM